MLNDITLVICVIYFVINYFVVFKMKSDKKRNIVVFLYIFYSLCALADLQNNHIPELLTADSFGLFTVWIMSVIKLRSNEQKRKI